MTKTYIAWESSAAFHCRNSTDLPLVGTLEDCCRHFCALTIVQSAGSRIVCPTPIFLDKVPIGRVIIGTTLFRLGFAYLDQFGTGLKRSHTQDAPHQIMSPAEQAHASTLPLTG
jgi:hypothetical protein